MSLFIATFVMSFCGYLAMRVGMLLIEAQQEQMMYR